MSEEPLQVLGLNVLLMSEIHLLLMSEVPLHTRTGKGVLSLMRHLTHLDPKQTIEKYLQPKTLHGYFAHKKQPTPLGPS